MAPRLRSHREEEEGEAATDGGSLKFRKTVCAETKTGEGGVKGMQNV